MTQRWTVAPRLSLYQMLRLSDPLPCRATLDERKDGEGRWRTGARVTAPLQLPCSPLGICFWVFFPPFPGLAEATVSSGFMLSPAALLSLLLWQMAFPSSSFLQGWGQARAPRRDGDPPPRDGTPIPVGWWQPVALGRGMLREKLMGKGRKKPVPRSQCDQSGCSGRTDRRYVACNCFIPIFSPFLPSPFAASPF